MTNWLIFNLMFICCSFSLFVSVLAVSPICLGQNGASHVQPNGMFHGKLENYLINIKQAENTKVLAYHKSKYRWTCGMKRTKSKSLTF